MRSFYLKYLREFVRLSQLVETKNTDSEMASAKDGKSSRRSRLNILCRQENVKKKNLGVFSPAEVRWVYQQFYLGGNSYKMYHGTSVDNAKKIADKGFKVGKGRGRFKRDGMLGFGVYASPDINKAREYAKPRYTDGKPGVVLELEVDMGPMIYRQGLKHYF